jgi:hypothetical protein
VIYSPDALAALQESVEHQGGALLPDPCLKQDVRRTTAQGYIHNKTEKKSTCGCGNTVRFVFPYDGEDDKAHLITVCAVCDAAGAMPRFCADVYEADPDMDIMLDERIDEEQEDEDGS